MCCGYTVLVYNYKWFKHREQQAYTLGSDVVRQLNYDHEETTAIYHEIKSAKKCT